MLDKRLKNLVVLVDAVCSKYSVLPSEFLQKGTTQDIQIFVLAERERVRREQKAQKKNIADTYSTSEIEELYSQWQQQHS